MISTHSKSIQDIRGISVLMVVFFHVAGLFDFVDSYQLFKLGGKGVLLFFVISGFIICSVHSVDRGASKFWEFAAKRASRIFAPYLIPFFIMLCLFLLSGRGTDWHRDPINIIRNIFLVQNPNESIHPYAWSMVFEIYYYVSFALVIIILRANVFIYAMIMMIPVLAFFLGLTDGFLIAGVPSSVMNVYFVTGVLLAKFAELFKLANIKFFAFAMLIVTFLVGGVGSNGVWLYLYIITFFVFYLSCEVSFKILSYIGNASYSIYLTHAIVLSIGKHVFLDRNILIFILLVVLSLVFGLLYHYFVEKPLVRLAQRAFYLKLKSVKTSTSA